jgi:hypothetical protein
VFVQINPMMSAQGYEHARPSVHVLAPKAKIPAPLRNVPHWRSRKPVRRAPASVKCPVKCPELISLASAQAADKEQRCEEEKTQRMALEALLQEVQLQNTELEQRTRQLVCCVRCLSVTSIPVAHACGVRHAFSHECICVCMSLKTCHQLIS